MCNLIDVTSAKTPITKARKKLWQIQSRFHCAVIGTCLTVVELKKLLIKTKIHNCDEFNDYYAHQTAISYATDKNMLSVAIHKLLDKKFSRQIKLLKQIKCSDDLMDFWKSQMQSHDITGTYWAIITHPKSTLSIWNEVFGDVHMLSHLQGATNRYSVQQINLIKTENSELRSKLKKAQGNSIHSFQANDDLKQQLSKTKKQLQRFVEKQKQDNTASVKLNPDNKQLQKQNHYLEKTLENKQQQLDQLKLKNECLSITKEKIQQEFLLLSERMSLLKTKLDGLPKAQLATKKIKHWSLNGKKILYLGGRNAVTPHIKVLVESHDGEFIHHDGGKEANKHQMQNQICQADMVFCPIDCISHDACLRAKHSCQKLNKVFVPLRSSGLSSFSNELQLQVQH